MAEWHNNPCALSAYKDIFEKLYLETISKLGTPYGIFEVIAALKVSSSLSVQG
jgi:hypothetical protein